MFCRYSGAPVRDNLYKSELRKLMFIVTLWSLCRLVKGVINVNDTNIYAQVCRELSKQEYERQITTWIFFILIYILCDIMPLAFVLDWSFMKVFTRKIEETESFIEQSDDEEELAEEQHR